MPRGKTNQPITVGVPHQWTQRPEIRALVEQGHLVHEFDFHGVDLILAPNAHQMNDMLLDYLPAALAAARKRKKGAKG